MTMSMKLFASDRIGLAVFKRKPHTGSSSGLFFIAIAFCVFALGLNFTTTPALAESAKAQRANRLINSGNPYLLQHAYNPVDWYPWGPEAQARAKAENKPIFLSVGYSTCYWCHVAKRTIYANPEIAKLMNKWFINVKVDREERPDIDETYMIAREILTGGGGWPNNVFMTPDLKPFFAGSYFPPADQPGVSGFPTVLKVLHEAWQTDPGSLREIGERLHKAIIKLGQSGEQSEKAVRINPGAWLTKARGEILSRRDVLEGGFEGGGNKFPESPLLNLLLTDYRLNGRKDSLNAARDSLLAMTFGGIHDHLGGGMHRYSTEPSWSVPHFEKMLYDNAQLLGLYSDLYDISRSQLAQVMALDIADYIHRRLTAPGGGFYTAEDADIEGKEGETYLWEKDDIVKALGSADAKRFFEIYELIPLPEDPDGPGVLRVRKDLSEIGDNKDRTILLSGLEDLKQQRLRLLALRDKRQQPLRDDKIVVMLNGLTIAALVRAGKLFDKPKWIESAGRAAAYLWQHAMEEKTGRLRRYVFEGKAWGEGFLEDYAHFGLGLVALSEATGEPVWLERARKLARAIETRFVKPDGRILIRVADSMSIVPAIDLQESDTPSGTSTAYALFSRLGKTDESFKKIASRLLARSAPNLAGAPDSWASFIAHAARVRAERGVTGLNDDEQNVSLARSIGSASHVKATALGTRGNDRDDVTVNLAIKPGYHINANPASLEFLVPTTVQIAGAEDARISYPAGKLFKPKFSSEGILVYEGSVSIKMELGKGGLDKVRSSPVNLEVQACTDTVCLEPSQLSVPIVLR